MTDITWSGRKWHVRSMVGSSAEAPGSNWWNDTTTFATLVGSELQISTAQDPANSNRWTSGEVQSYESFGYGTYEWTMGTTNLGTIHHNVVFSLLVCDNANTDFNSRQINIDFSKWGNASATNDAQYTVAEGNVFSFAWNIPSGTDTRHRFRWSPGRIEFQSYDSAGETLYRKVYVGTDVPPPGNEKVIMRTWLQGGPDFPPSSTTTIALASFSHTPLGEETGLSGLTSSAVSTATGLYRTGEQAFITMNRNHSTVAAVPTIYCHDALTSTDVMPTLRDPVYFEEMKSSAKARMPVITALLGGATTWGNDSSIDAVDDAIDHYATAQPVSGADYRTASTPVNLWGDGMGALTVLNWAWRNPDRVAAILLRNPVVALDDFHDRNASLQAQIEAAYGGLSAYNAALPDHDPEQNWSLIRPLGPKIKIWYGGDDDLIPTNEVEAFANAVGCEAVLIPDGTHTDYDTPTDQTTSWLSAAAKRSIVKQYRNIDWVDTNQWANLSMGQISYSDASAAPDPWQFSVVSERGRIVNPVGGTGGSNDRRVFFDPTFQAVNSEIHSRMHGFDGFLAGQQGNFHRVIQRPDGTGQAVVAWQNFFFLAPWTLNFGFFNWDTNALTFTTEQSGSGIAPGVLAHVSGTITGATRTSNVSTYTYTDAGFPPINGDVLSITMGAGATSFSGSGTISNVTGTTFQMANTGTNGSTTVDGTYANHFRGLFTPYHVRTRLIGRTMDWKTWYDEVPEPDWGDPDWGGTHVFPQPGIQNIAGSSGFFMAHIIGPPSYLEQGVFETWEL